MNKKTIVSGLIAFVSFPALVFIDTKTLKKDTNKTHE